MKNNEQVDREIRENALREKPEIILPADSLSYRPAEDVGRDIELAAQRAGYPNWTTWASEDLDAAYKIMEDASRGEVVDPSTDSTGSAQAGSGQDDKK